MGAKGPVPKRSDARRRRNKPDVAVTKVDIAALSNEEIEIPAPDEDWHPIALQWYQSLARSGQATMYEPSDWATAYVLTEALSRELQPQPVIVNGSNGEPGFIEMHTLPIKGAAMTSLLKGFGALLATEGDRRRLSIELERERGRAAADAAARSAGVTPIADRRAARAGKAG